MSSMSWCSACSDPLHKPLTTQHPQNNRRHRGKGVSETWNKLQRDFRQRVLHFKRKLFHFNSTRYYNPAKLITLTFFFFGFNQLPSFSRGNETLKIITLSVPTSMLILSGGMSVAARAFSEIDITVMCIPRHFTNGNSNDFNHRCMWSSEYLYIQ